MVRAAALLHDIGKPLCWANQENWANHVNRTHQIVSHMFDKEVADLAMHHHSGSSYEQDCLPRNDLEWVVAVADTIASGADRPEEAVSGGPVASMPVRLTHLLSDGSTIVKKTERADLGMFIETLKAQYKSQPLEDATLEKLHAFLASSLARWVPADTRPPVNDTSLYHHMKLTAAIANCAYRERQHGRNTTDYRVAVVSGDADQIGAYVNCSLRIPDLRGRSARIIRGSQEAAAVFARTVGPECVIYQGGGGFLALSPPAQAEKLATSAKQAFEEATGGRCTMTVSHIERNGRQLQEFGEVWREAIQGVRTKKLTPQQPPQQITEESQICDACQREKATHQGRPLPTTPPRNELLCDYCYAIRTETLGTWMDTLKDEKGYVAVLRLDGNDVGGLLTGRSLKKFKKSTTPSRLAAVSSLIQDSIQNGANLIGKHSGVTIFIGGDDLLALVPGREAFNAVVEIARRYSASMNGQAGISCSIAFLRHKSPVYFALEASEKLLRKAKEQTSGGVAFALTTAEGAENQDPETRRVFSWAEFNTLLGTVNQFQKSSAASQMRRVVKIVASGGRAKEDRLEYGKAYVKYQMARGTIPWPEGESLLHEIDNGIMVEAFSIYSMFMGD